MKNKPTKTVQEVLEYCKNLQENNEIDYRDMMTGGAEYKYTDETLSKIIKFIDGNDE